MSNKMKIFCKNLGEYIPFTGGESLSEIFNRLSNRINITPICARVNNKTEDMQYPVFSPKQVEFLDRNLAFQNGILAHHCLPHLVQDLLGRGGHSGIFGLHDKSPFLGV